jgi:putative ATP-dependent endonuclease of OLD family
MAAELLLLQSHPEQVPFLLIEEPEAHLHPQHQSLFMQLLAARAAAPSAEEPDRRQVQVLLTTHSPHLAAGADVASLVLMAGHCAYPLSEGKTRLYADDYGFLRRFLDATKANLFFARGVIMVEGDAENLLLPAIARRLGRPLENHGVSIVKVGHVGLFRYSRILQRTAGPEIPVAVALLHDRDIPPDIAKQLVGERKTESEWDADQKAKRLTGMQDENGQGVRAFISEQWTLEYDLARQPEFAPLLHRAIKLARASRKKISNEVIPEADAELAEWRKAASGDADTVALAIFRPLYESKVSKAETAEQLANLIDHLTDTPGEFRAKCPSYLSQAIDYVTRRPAAPADGAE